MANHVSNFVRITNINEDVIKKVKEIFEYDDDKKEYQEAHSLTLVNNIYGTDFTDETLTRSWMEENIGAKWVYGCITEVYDDEIKLDLTSAWDPVSELIFVLSKVLQKVKPDVVVESQFEDESYNSAGVSLFTKDYNDTEYIDMDDWDVELFWEDDQYRDDFYVALSEMLDEHKRLYNENKND